MNTFVTGTGILACDSLSGERQREVNSSLDVNSYTANGNVL